MSSRKSLTLNKSHLDSAFLFAISLLVIFSIEGAVAHAADTNDTIPVSIRVHADQPKGDWRPIWRFFGADEPNYAYMKDGQQLISDLGQLAPDQTFFRTHNLLTSGDGTPALKWGSTGAYTEDTNGQPIYNWTIVDRIFNTYLERHVRPYVEVGFMPEALSVKPEPYQHHWTPTASYNQIYTGWAYPPKNYAKWSELVFHWAQHCVKEFGKSEVAHWYWETWNEPNIGYWQGSQQNFFKLHDATVDAVRRAFPDAKVGGPDSAGGGTKYFREFLEHCLHETNLITGQVGTPLDFISFHAKGSPTYTNDHVRMGIANQMRNIDSAFGIVASFPEYKSKPIIIGESDPDGCAACQGAQLAYRNGTIYASYTAASIARELELADRHGVNLEGALTWAFEFEDQPPFAGFRVLASSGIELPVLNVFRMLSKMDGRQIAVESSGAVPLSDMLKSGVRGNPDISALAALDQNRLCILVWHYHDDEIAGPDADINLALDGLPSNAVRLRVHQFRIDADHSNAFTEWQRLGSPEKISPDQYAQLKKAAQLTEAEAPVIHSEKNSSPQLQLRLPRQAVALVVVEW
ncbi:MAG TPA: beta-xylosidase [Verrucomicrobiae bacterium]|nr:beta-xylosidase [Verrucomicrobiae bacterium]